MNIEQAYDKVVLSHEDVQAAMREAVEKKLGRKVRGDVIIHCQQTTVRAANTPAFTPSVQCSAHCYLESQLPFIGG